MKDLLTFLIHEITGIEDFTVAEEQVDDKINLTVMAPQETVGLIIGKEGKTIKNIRKILAIKATQENTVVSINVNP
jgi:predicted RNA-binding protein YlqC (UPF0109 family)